MEHPQPETQRNAQTKVHEPQPKSDQNDSARVPNVDENAAGLVKASGSQGPTEQSMECTVSPRGSIKKSVHWNPELFTESTFVASPNESPRYFSSSSSSMSSPSFSVKDTVDTVRTVLGIWRRKVGEATRKAENLAENTWQHLKTNPSLSEAALGRIARQTKVLAEGGYEKIFQNTFETVPEEQLQKAYACYVSTSVGPVMGILYISTAKIAYCSDNPLSYIVDDQTEWSYYKGEYFELILGQSFPKHLIAASDGQALD